MIDNITYSSGLGKSDHVCINFRLKCSSVHNVTKQPTFNFSKGDYDRVRLLLNKINWEVLSIFKQMYDKYYSNHLYDAGL